ncbi:hypothetical protein ESM34_12295, partial [Staphylococcus sp. SNAZ 59]
VNITRQTVYRIKHDRLS